MTNRIYANTEVTLRGTVLDASDVLTNPASISFEYRIDGYTGWLSASPVNISTGVYDATFTPEFDGFLFYRWTVDTPTVTEEGTVWIEPTRFKRFANTRDYLGCHRHW